MTKCSIKGRTFYERNFRENSLFLVERFLKNILFIKTVILSLINRIFFNSWNIFVNFI